MLSCIYCHLPDNLNEPLPRKFVINHVHETNIPIPGDPLAGNPFAALQLFPVHRQPEKNSYE